MEADPHRIRSRLDHARRRAGLDRNPLRRRADRVQSAVAILLVALFLVAAPLAVLSVGSRVYDARLRTEQTQAGERHEVTGKVNRPASAQAARLTWREADGTWHTARYQGGKPADATDRVWIDRSGQIVPAPRGRSQTVLDTGMAAVAVILLLSISLGTVHHVVRCRMDRSRYRSWDTDWERASVRWGLPGHRPDQ